ncbi:MAG: hypothetical protein ABF633_00495 [Clostridium sp.]|uniref:hypothetical protein n=1 Tax=Clostridium sp. TaxID=1506 RepID=UPI0039EBC6A9
MFHNLNLLQINKLLENKIGNCELISDISLTKGEHEEILAKVIDILEYANKGDNLKLVVENSPLVFANVLVYIAMYEYEGNYWDKVKEILQLPELSQQSKTILAWSVQKVINKYNLKAFNDGGYKYITPIICHSGIPNKSLAGIFDIILNNYDNTTVTTEALIDNIKYFIRYKVDTTVYRFITFNEDRAITFLHNLKDLVTVVEDNRLTLDETLTKYNYFDERIITQYYKWRDEKKIDKQKKRNSNRILSPKIRFDGISLGVYLYLPVQHIDKHYNNCIEWNIKYDNGEVINITGSLYYQNRECISEEQNIALKPSNTYKINLTYDGEILGEWVYDGVNEGQPYIIFDEYDNAVKGNKILTKSVTCILREEYRVVETDLEITYCNLPNKYWCDFRCVNIILLCNCDFIRLLSSKEEIIIEYKKVNAIELQEGNLLFNESYRRDEIPMYSNILPKISLEYESDFFKNIIIDTYSLIIINLKENINVVKSIKSLDYIIIKDRVTIDLNYIEIFNNMIYGEYEVRVLEGRNIKRVFTLRYLPKISISENNLDKWPKDKKGYVKNSFKIKCPDNVTFNFTDCIQEEVWDSSIKNISIESLTYSEYLIGTIDIMQSRKVITFPVKKKIRNLQWSLIKEGEQKIQWKKDPNILFVKELTNINYNMVLKINDDINDEYTIKLYLLDYKDIVYQESTINLRRDKINGVSLNRFLDSIKLNDANRYFIKMEVYNKYNFLLCSFIPLIIKDRITVKNIRYVNNESGIVSISWEQDGNIDKETMEMKLYNISKPWEKAISIPLTKGNFRIENNTYNLIINSNEFLIPDDGVYLFEVEDNANNENLFFKEDETYKPIKILENSVYKYKNNFKNIINSFEINNLSDGIFYFAYCFDTKYVKEVFYKIRTLKITEDYNIDILKSIYTIYKNRNYFIKNCEEKDRKVAQYTIALLMVKFCNKYNIFKVIEDLIDIDEYCVKRFLDYINKHIFKVNKEYIVPAEKRTILWNLDRERSFMIEIRSGRVSKNILTNNIIDWVSIHNDKEILILGEQCKTCKLLNNRGCLNKYLKGKCQGRTLNMSPKLIGSKNEYEKLFNSIDMSDKRKLNKLDSINLLDYFEDDGIKLFNKSYVELLYNWSNKNGMEVRNKIHEDIKEYMNILNTFIKKEITNTNFQKLYYAFLKRRDNNEKSFNTLAYYLGVVVLIMSLDSFDKLQNKISKNEKVAITKLYNKFRENLKDLFIRDLVLVELYVTGLGE